MCRDGADEPCKQTTKGWTKAALAATCQSMFKLQQPAPNPNLFYTVPAQANHVDII